MRGRTRLRASAAFMTLVAGLSLPAQTYAQMGGMPAPSQPQTPAPTKDSEPAQEDARPARPNPALIAFDLLIVRPLGFVAVAVGAVLFLPAALITAPMGRDSVETAKESFVTVPTNDVFKRPLGEF